MLERSSPVPLYQQLRDHLLARIETRRWRPGDLIPGDQELMDEFGVSRATVRQAFDALAQAGIVQRHRGRGTFVAEPKLTHGPDTHLRLSDSLRARGLAPGWTVVALQEVASSEEIAERLALPERSPVTRLERIRLAEGDPIGRHVAHAVCRPELIDPGTLGRGESLDYLSSRLGSGRLPIERVIEAVAADAEDERWLGVETGAPMLRIRRRVWDADGRPLEYLCATYRGDRFQYLTHATQAGLPGQPKAL
jgi:GntR family transcriptional regulator